MASIDPLVRDAPISWRHRLPRTAPVDRHDALVAATRGKRAIHVGFVDELLELKLRQGVWLHERLAAGARSLVGLDISDTGVEFARATGYEAYVVDVQSPEAVARLGLEPAEVVVAGELIEHLDAPGPFLRAMRQLVEPGGALLVTTPNAYRLLNFLTPVAGVELVHPDHTAWHSPSTLGTLLTHSGWVVERIGYYVNPARTPVGSPPRRALGAAANAVRRLEASFGRLAPYWSDGIVAWAHAPAEANAAAGEATDTAPASTRSR